MNAWPPSCSGDHGNQLSALTDDRTHHNEPDWSERRAPRPGHQTVFGELGNVCERGLYGVALGCDGRIGPFRQEDVPQRAVSALRWVPGEVVQRIESVSVQQGRIQALTVWIGRTRLTIDEGGQAGPRGIGPIAPG